MSSPATKRRRINVASQALSKPFRSPLKPPVSASAPRDVTILDPQRSSELAPFANSSDKEIPEASKARVQSAELNLSPRLIKKTFSSLVSPVTLNADVDIAALIKIQRQLEKQLRELKEELDTAEQARKIEADSKKKGAEGQIDGDLLELISKWRGASRQAAEELFTGVRDRVNRMGGPKAWKEMQDKQKEFQISWDAEPQQELDSDNENVDVEKRDLYAEYDIDQETANERDARGGNSPQEAEGAEDEFTMSMMLRSLNIALSIIGYDREQQRWTDAAG